MKHSIIVTGYNCETYIEDCIDSVLKQTYDNFEILIYNDGSTDNTKKFLEKYKTNVKIKILNQDENLGALYGRFFLNKIATGDIISFLGMDDMLSENALEVLNKYYTPNIKMTYGNWVDYHTGKIHDIEEYSNEVFKVKNFRRVKWRATALNSFRKNILDLIPEKLLKHDGKFFTNCTDLAYSFPCLEICNKDEVAVIKEPIYIYRSNHQNTTLKRLGRTNKTEVRKIISNISIFNI
jgi:glycosyltransferase involved in cell wall biosynthesis